MSTFVECESYKHKYAKKIVKEWFDSYGDGYDWKKYKTTEHDISFRSNRKSGVWEEYPVTIFEYDNYTSSSIEQLWDEEIDYSLDSSNYDLDIKEAIINENIENIETNEFIKIFKKLQTLYGDEYLDYLKKNKFMVENILNVKSYIHDKYSIHPPTYEESLKHGNTIAILDLAIAHKGQIEYGIEICHTNPVSEEKIIKLRKLGLKNLIELDAEWVLRQTRRPEIIKVNRWLI